MLNEREQAAHDPTIAETAQGLSLTFEKLKADISQSRAARFVLAVLEKLKGAIQMEKTLKTGKIGQFSIEFTTPEITGQFIKRPDGLWKAEHVALPTETAAQGWFTKVREQNNTSGG